jgi:putative glutamine amidotransferase
MKPVVLLPCDNREIGGHPAYVLGQKYADAVRDQAQCTPMFFPATRHTDIDAYLAIADGILLTGSPSNVDPSYFGESVLDASLPLDAARDAATLPIIRRAVELGIPLLAICRGLQEINVALGGSLHQAVQNVEGREDHRGARGRLDANSDETYALAHPINIVRGGHLERLVGNSELMVNSVHGQGIHRIAEGLRAEAHAPDGQIEAVTIVKHTGFNLAMQWHPEWRAWENESSSKIFAAFGEACEAFRRAKQTSTEPAVLLPD